MPRRNNNRRLSRRVRYSYFISTLSIALVLFLLGSVGYLILNAVKASHRMREQMSMYVMLRDGLSAEQTALVGARLDSLEGVKQTRLITKSEAAAGFRDHVGDDFEEFLGYNPLPDSYEVKIEAQRGDLDRQMIRATDSRISSWKEVDEVVYQKGVMEQIGSNISRFNIILLFFGGTLLIISLILLDNTIRLSIYSKRYIINTMKQVGASKRFIMHPFLVDSLLKGLYAALIGAVLFLAMAFSLQRAMPEAVLLSDTTTMVTVLASMFVAGVLISFLFTLTALNRFINLTSSKIYLY